MDMFTVEKDWVTKAGYRAVVIVGCFSGKPHHRCGYIGVPEGHPCYGANYDIVQCNVHGGMTYANGGDYPVPSGLWWFGYDCAHYCDAPIVSDGLPRIDGETVKTLAFCEGECEQLAEELLTKKPTPGTDTD